MATKKTACSSKYLFPVRYCNEQFDCPLLFRNANSFQFVPCSYGDLPFAYFHVSCDEIRHSLAARYKLGIRIEAGQRSRVSNVVLNRADHC